MTWLLLFEFNDLVKIFGKPDLRLVPAGTAFGTPRGYQDPRLITIELEVFYNYMRYINLRLTCFAYLL